MATCCLGDEAGGLCKGSVGLGQLPVVLPGVPQAVPDIEDEGRGGVTVVGLAGPDPPGEADGLGEQVVAGGRLEERRRQGGGQGGWGGPQRRKEWVVGPRCTPVGRAHGGNVVVGAGCGAPMVEVGTEEQQSCGGGGTHALEGQGKGRRQPAACRITADRERADRVPEGKVDGQGVVESGGERVFGGEAVVGRDDVETLGQPRGDGNGHAGTAERVPATVQVEEGGRPRGGPGPQATNAGDLGGLVLRLVGEALFAPGRVRGRPPSRNRSVVSEVGQRVGIGATAFDPAPQSGERLRREAPVAQAGRTVVS